MTCSSHSKISISIDLAFITKTVCKWLIVCGILLLSYRPQAQIVDEFPADVAPVVAPPYSLFLSDYGDPTLDLLTANIIFNDFNEASWTFRLKLRIESPDILLETRPSFIPSRPITVVPGELFQFKGADWAEYLLYENLRVGGDQETFLNSGRLPEGNYRITIQVLDYITGEPLSEESSFFWWMGLFSPPLLNLPRENAYINPNEAQIAFNWQLFNIQSPNGAQTSYQFTLYEVIEPDATREEVDPLNAFQNGQLLEIYRSDMLMTTSFVYGLSEPSLEVGKAYVYRVQALESNGRDAFKNDGYSEFRRFYYGWPTGGKIALEFPGDEQGFLQWDVPSVRWSSPDNRLPGQPVSYEVRIAEKGKTENPESALRGELWHYHKTSQSAMPSSESYRLEEDLSKSTSYAWEVIGYSSDQEVARSKAQTFHGPPLLERFYAGTHQVLVDYVNDDPDNLKGGGRVRLSEPGAHPRDDKWTAFEFEGLKVELVGSQWILREGEVLFDAPQEEAVIALSPIESINGNASFEVETIRLNSQGLSVYGDFSWYLHLPSLAEERAQLSTQSGWVDFNDFTLTGYVKLAEDNLFRLLEPFGFSLQISPSSSVFLARNNFGMNLSGQIDLPISVKNVAGDGPVQVSFFEQRQLFWFERENLEMEALLATQGSNIEFRPSDYLIDFSFEKSTGHYADQPEWMGLQFLNYEVVIPRDFDFREQITMTEPVSKSFQHTDQSEPAYVDSQGLSFQSTLSLDTEGQSLYLNTFPASFDPFELVITNGSFSDESALKGEVILPLLNEDDPFEFEVDVDRRGFSPDGPVWLEGLDGYRFIHNTAVEQQVIYVTVKRAIFNDNDHLNMVLDIEWPFLDLSMEALQDFKMWGNYNIGFYTPDGLRALDQQIVTAYQGYPYTVDAVTAGRDQGFYGFGVSGKLDLGENVSGQAGLPSFNLYSLEKHEILPGDYKPAKINGESTPPLSEAEMQERIDEIEAAIAAEQKSVTDELDETVSRVGGELERLLEGYANAEASDINPEDFISSPGGPPQSPGIQTNSAQSKFVDAFSSVVATALSDAATEPLQKQINRLDKKIRETVDSLAIKGADAMKVAVREVVQFAVDQIAKPLEKKPDIVAMLNSIGDDLVVSISDETKASLLNSAKQNITIPTSALLQDTLMGKIDQYVENTIQVTIKAFFESGSNPVETLASELGNVDELVGSIGSSVLEFISPSNIYSTVLNLGDDFVSGIDKNRILTKLKKSATDALADYGMQVLQNQLSGLSNEFLSGEAGIGAALAVGGLAADILKGGGIKGALANGIEIKHTSKLFDFIGKAWLNEDHPIYGEVFSGMVDVLVKIPQDFKISASYMNGRTKEGVKYWFIEVGGGAGAASGNNSQSSNDNSGGNNSAAQEKALASSDEMGKEMDQDMQEAPSGIKLGVMEIMAIRARLYKNMRPEDGELGSMVPDESLDFGAYMHLVCFGPSDGAKMRLEVEGSVETHADGNLLIDFNGNLQLGNKNPKLATIDPKAAIQGTIEISYNKHERHFFGYATVDFKTEGMCGEGSLLVDVKPSKWRVALGTREDRIGLVPACAGPSFYGWVDLNDDFVEVGFGMGMAFYKDFDFGVKKFKIGLTVDAGFNANVFVSVGWKPVQLREVGIMIELWARIVARYRALMIRGSIELVDLYLFASSTLRFNPKPALLYGELEGNINLIKIIKINFKQDYELEL